MTPELMTHLSDPDRVRIAIAILRGCRDMHADIIRAIAILRFAERLEEMGIDNGEIDA